MVIKTLRQKPILDKIKAKIEQSYYTPNNDYDRGCNYGLYMATQIIDHYKAESENEKMTIDEAIKHTEEITKEKEEQAWETQSSEEYVTCKEYVDKYRQLAKGAVERM